MISLSVQFGTNRRGWHAALCRARTLRYGSLPVGFAAWFRTKAIKTVIKGGVFGSAITFAVLISTGCNHVPGVVADQHPCPSRMSRQVEFVGMATKVERATIAVIIKLNTSVAVFFDWLEFVFH